MEKKAIFIFLHMTKLGYLNDTSSSMFYNLIKLVDCPPIFIEFLPSISQSQAVSKKLLELLKFNIKDYNKYKIISTPCMPPFHKINQKFNFVFTKIISKIYFDKIISLAKLDKDLKTENIFVIFNPLIYSLIGEKIKNLGKIIYVVLDDWENLMGDEFLKNKIKETEMELARNSLGIFVVSSNLKMKFLHLNKNVFVIPNGVNLEKFKPSVENPYQYLDDGSLLIGFVGTLGPWIDVDLIFKIAMTYPFCKIIIAGPDNIGFKKMLNRKKLNNIIYLGTVEYERVPDLISVFDICIVPFDNSEISINSSPIKIYEYLSLEKQVVTSYIKTVEEELKDYVFLAKSREEFINYIGDIIKNKNYKPKAPIEKFDWSFRVKNMLEYIENLRGH